METFEEIFVLRVVKVDIEMETFRKCLLRVVKVLSLKWEKKPHLWK
jgi:hypothetical protein